MGAITALYARKVIDAAADELDRAALLSVAGLAVDDAPNVKRMLPDDDYYRLLETIAQTLKDVSGFPMKVGRSMKADDYGAFGLAWKTAPTLRGSLERAERYARLLTSVTRFEVRDHAQGAFFVLYRDGPRRLGLRMSNEATLASSLSIMREVAPGPVVPLEVHCRHAAPDTIKAHETYFGCPMIFGSQIDAILLSGDDLKRANRLGDPAISRFLEPHLERELEATAQETSFENVLLRRISDRLSEGPPRAAEMAREMGMSERTMHRRLADGGLSFQLVLEKARRRLAEGLLVQSDHAIAEIAFLTGFSEQSSFSRAFKRWSDETPAAFRERHLRA